MLSSIIGKANLNITIGYCISYRRRRLDKRLFLHRMFNQNRCRTDGKNGIHSRIGLSQIGGCINSQQHVFTGFCQHHIAYQGHSSLNQFQMFIFTSHFNPDIVFYFLPLFPNTFIFFLRIISVRSLFLAISCYF